MNAKPRLAREQIAAVATLSFRTQLRRLSSGMAVRNLLLPFSLLSRSASMNPKPRLTREQIAAVVSLSFRAEWPVLLFQSARFGSAGHVERNLQWLFLMVQVGAMP
jgi:hypothetical protein